MISSRWPFEGSALEWTNGVRLARVLRHHMCLQSWERTPDMITFLNDTLSDALLQSVAAEASKQVAQWEASQKTKMDRRVFTLLLGVIGLLHVDAAAK